MIGQGVYDPTFVNVYMTTALWAAGAGTATIQSIELYAGATIGSARLRFSTRFAKDATAVMGDVVRITIGGNNVFRGTIGYAPYEVSSEADAIEVVLFDDKWGMSARVIGQIGIGTQDEDPAGFFKAGFKDVGFNFVFNRDGKPNKDAGSREFNTGSAAVFWTLKDIMLLVFEKYIDTGVAQCAAGDLGTAYNRTPNHVNLIGQTALQAVDTISQIAGESWCLRPTSSHSNFKPVIPGAGTLRTLRLFAPSAGKRSTQADEYTPSSYSVGSSVLNVRDVHQAVSDLIVKESVYSSAGADPLLVEKANFKDKKYVRRFEVDVSKYFEHSLGYDLTAGSPPKPLLSHLVTRMNDVRNDYLTAAEIVATPALRYNPPVKVPVWVATDGVSANRRLVTGGYRIDTDTGTIDFKDEIDVRKTGTDDGDEKLSIKDEASLAVWMTVATVLLTPEYDETDAGSKYLATSYYEVISKSDLVPQHREDSQLPDLGGDNSAFETQAAGAAEDYVDVAARLADALASAEAAAPAIERPLTFFFDFLPLFYIGDRIAVTGRTIGTSGNEVVIGIKYPADDAECQIRASDAVIGIDPDMFVEDNR